MHVARRTVLAATLGVVAGGCTDGRRASGPQIRATEPTTPSSPAAPTSGPPTVQRWRPSAGDLEPACKRAAVRAVEAGAGGRLQVIDVQYGGLLPDSASVLVVTRVPSNVTDVGRALGHTFDVRVAQQGGVWRVEAVHPSRPGPPVAPSQTARAVLDHARIDLPPAARRDVESGRLHETTLAALLAVARDFRIGISVIRSGHPLHVFGTTRLSDHPQGRAFDTWQIDGHAVVDPRTSRQLVTEYMHAVAAAGSYNVGGPYLLGSAPQWFTDATHHDHVHAGFPG
ncbi:MAG TPA: hypothetical protein VHO29_10465 [Marmoricola sp.]|nr:hypothetical protein [Marmoricola sp.]